MFNQYEYAKLIENGKPENRGKDHFPVVKLISPDTNSIWLMNEIHCRISANGIHEFGKECLEFGYLHLPDIISFRGTRGLRVMRDKYFTAKYPLSVYSEAASYHGRIIEDPMILDHFS